MLFADHLYSKIESYLKLIIFVCLFFSGTAVPVMAQGRMINGVTGVEMLNFIKQDLKDYYYDPTFRGMDLEARFKEAEKQIKAAKSSGQILAILAQVLVDLNDSHTRFIPPRLVTSVDYGWRMQMIGDKCYVTAVKAGSEAASKGLKVSDLIYSIDSFEPTRDSLWKIQYSYEVLPRPTARVVIQDTDGSLRAIEIAPRISKTSGKEVSVEPDKALYYEVENQLIICKLRDFELSDNEVDEMMKRIAGHKALILDLRGNPGGLVAGLQRLVGYLFDRDIKIADAKERKGLTPITAKTRSERNFKGRLIVLVDSESASAAEMFARIIQLEKRGVVIGDQTSGAVMISFHLGHPIGYKGAQFDPFGPTAFFGVSITDADLIMTDGKSLEHTGVTPDQILMPSGEDLAARRDPVMAKATGLLGIGYRPESAGRFFPAREETEIKTKEIKEDKKN
jgi:carboxyl-terminal processing protease